MSRFLNVLRSWLVMVSIIAMGNTLQSFRDHTFLYEKLYTGKPDLVNGLQARTFGIWTLLSSVIRCLCAIDIHNKMTAANADFCFQHVLKARDFGPRPSDMHSDSIPNLTGNSKATPSCSHSLRQSVLRNSAYLMCISLNKPAFT
ncbi:ergosterol biosynthetic protein 28 homolog isoform X1 [Sagmatias obliquidens]|uniref:ergosterol biosynthetic protein 28 homolog isoform X1 n=1 Tax=Sagmatias obliquidens TaxID=3371155 RepID=UPI000F4427C2|nr:probable ergosterol biosynthetic protein 28 isoform X1 [Lagenorhynchus obliquidens]